MFNHSLVSLFNGTQSETEKILWLGTSFPSGTEVTIRQELLDIYHKYGSDTTSVIEFLQSEN